MMQKLSIIHTDPDWYLIHKPVDWSVQDEQATRGVLNTLKEQLGEPELALVHRLDKVTSGLLLIGRNSAATACLSQQFANRTVQKFYLAIAEGKPAKKQGAVVGDMAKARRGCWKLLRTKSKPAISQFFSHAHSAGRRWYLLKPLTGKTHQLRVALKSLGCPIWGDTAYGANAADRTYLHAYHLAFDWEGKREAFTLPPEFGEAFKAELPEGWHAPDLLKWPRLS